MVPIKDSGAGTYAISPYTLEGPETPLIPFTMTSNGPWYDSTASNRATKKFGYTYAGLYDWNTTTEQQQSYAVNLIHQLYNPDNKFTKRASTISSAAGFPRLIPKSKQWFVSISVNKLALLGQRFTILLYLSTPPTAPAPTDTTCIGAFPILPPPIKSTSNSAASLPVVTAYSEFSLQSGLEGAGVDMEDSAGVVGWLKGKLQWVVVRADGERVDLDGLTDGGGLKVEVYEESLARGATAASLPVWGGKVVHGEVMGV